MHKRRRRLAKKDNRLKRNLIILLFVFGALSLVGAVSYNGALVANKRYRQEEDAKMKQLEEQYNQAKNKEYNKYQADALAKIEEENKKLEQEAQKKAAEEKAQAEKIAFALREAENSQANNMEKTVEPSPSLPAQSSNNANMTFLGTLESTAYTHTGGNMANGEYPYVGAVACNLVPLGTQIYIEGLGYYVVKDRIAWRSQLDIFFNTESECMNYGRRIINVYIVN